MLGLSEGTLFLGGDMLKEFKEFLLRGNVIDLAVGIVIGAAFGVLVTTFTESMISPLIGLITGGTDLGRYTFSVSDATFSYGDVLQAMIIFVLTAAAVFFFVVKPVNKLMNLRKTEPEVGSPTKECPECLSSIPANARRCAFCTSEVVAA
jgi:large conductance mechanosensitive channel